MDKITIENVFEVDVSKLALDSKFGSLVFTNAEKQLKKAQTWLKEMHDLRFGELLLPNNISQVNNLTKKLVELLEWLRVFDIGAVQNAKYEHDQFNNRVDHFYNDVFTQISMGFLPYLRGERRRENPEEKSLEEEVQQITQLRAELEVELKKVREASEETKRVREETEKIRDASKGERAAVRLANHFDDEARKYQTSADNWFKLVKVCYVSIVVIILGFGLWYWIGKASLTWQAGFAKLVLVAALWYGLSFLIRNYNVQSHLAAVNRHRAAVARTLDDFLASSPEKQDEMLRYATEAMFKHAPIGFISKAEKDNSSPIYEIINNMVGSRSTQ